MKLLFISFYFPPDLSAGSFRSSALIEQLKKKFSQIEIYTAFPSRYRVYKEDTKEYEHFENVKIHRIKIPGHYGGMFSQAFSFIFFFRSVLKKTKKHDYDAIFATSSRLFTAFLGSVISYKKNIPLYLDIRDIFLDTLKDLLSPISYFFASPFIGNIEKFTFNRARHINLISEGFKNYFELNFKCRSYSYYTNGVDDIFLKKFENNNIENSKKLILYAGNIGSGQGLEKIIPDVARELKSFNFRIIGDGGMRKELENRIKNLPNVMILKPMNRNKLIEHYSEADLLFMHLNDYDAFKKVLPSKIFEYAATGKPIVSGVSGYAKKFQETYVNNSICFTPCSSQEAINAIQSISYSTITRDKFIKKFNRSEISSKLASSIYKELAK